MYILQNCDSQRADEPRSSIHTTVQVQEGRVLTGRPVSQTLGQRASIICFSLLRRLSGRMPSLVIFDSEMR